MVEFNETRAVRTMDERNMKVAMLFTDPRGHTRECSRLTGRKTRQIIIIVNTGRKSRPEAESEISGSTGGE